MNQPITRLDLPRPAPAPDAGPLDARLYDLVETRVRRLMADNPDPRHEPGDPRARPSPGRPEQGRPDRGDHRRARAPCRRGGAGPGGAGPRRCASSGTWSSTTSAWACSKRTRSAAGSAAQRPPETWATPCSCCSRAARLPSRNGWSGSRTAWRPPRRTSWRRGRGPGRTGRRSGRRSTPGTRRTCRRCSRRCAPLPAPVLAEPELARLDRAIADASAALEAHATWIGETLERATDDWPLGTERYDELVRLRAFGDLDPGRHPGHRVRAAADQPRGAPRHRARAGPGRRPGHRHRPAQARPPGHVRGSAGRLPGRHGAVARLPRRARAGSPSPTTRSSRSSRRRSTCGA